MEIKLSLRELAKDKTIDQLVEEYKAELHGIAHNFVFLPVNRDVLFSMSDEEIITLYCQVFNLDKESELQLYKNAFIIPREDMIKKFKLSLWRVAVKEVLS